MHASESLPLIAVQVYVIKFWAGQRSGLKQILTGRIPIKQILTGRIPIKQILTGRSIIRSLFRARVQRLIVAFVYCAGVYY